MTYSQIKSSLIPIQTSYLKFKSRIQINLLPIPKNVKNPTDCNPHPEK